MSEIDNHGSYGLNVNLQDGRKVFSKKVESSLYKYGIMIFNELARNFNIPVIKYSYFNNDGNSYVSSVSFDENVEYDEIINDPIYYEDIYDGILLMKDFLLKYDNGMDTYQEFLKQIFLSLVVMDSDRCVDNFKFYRKENSIYIAPYLDIHMIFNLDCKDSLLFDTYYLTEEEFNKTPVAEDISYEECMNSFNNDFNNSREVFNQLTFGTHTISDIWKLLYEEMVDKSLFDRFVNINDDEIICNIDNNNARKVFDRLLKTSRNKMIESLSSRTK